MKTIYVINYFNEPDSDFYDETGGIGNPNQIRRFSVFLREEIEKAGYRFALTQTCEEIFDPAAILCLAGVTLDSPILQQLHRFPKERCFLYVTEPPHLISQAHLYSPLMKEFFGTIFVLLDDLVDQQIYVKTFHPHVRDTLCSNSLAFSQKKLCVMIQRSYGDEITLSPYHSLYNERRLAASYFGQKIGEFKLFGNFWHGNPCWEPNFIPERRAFAMIRDKLQVLYQYKFCLCYENSRHLQGCMSERIFDCFYGGCIPVYWGCENITDYVPAECFIDRRRFASNEELYHFLKQMDEQTHHSYLDAAKRYIFTPQEQLFYGRNVAKNVVETIRRRAGSAFFV